jgi:hypothetical protein
MCGIFGVIGGKDPMQKRMLAVLNQTRGSDGIGFMYDGKRMRCKESISDAIIEKRIQKEVWNAEVFLGHTRGASRAYGIGGTEKKNTHPFRSGDITGAHNGCVSGWKSVIDKHKKEHKEVDEFTVDSQVIIWGLDKFGIDFFEQIDGYGAVWWLDKKHPDQIRFWLYNQSFYIGYGDDGSIAFSSLGNHLKMCGFKRVSKMKDEGQRMYLDIPERRFCELAEDMKPKVVPITTTSQQHLRGAHEWSRASVRYNNKQTGTTSSYSGVEKFEISELLKFNIVINRALFANRLMQWCSVCNDAILQCNSKETEMKNSIIICPRCQGNTIAMTSVELGVVQNRLSLLGHSHPLNETLDEFIDELSKGEEEGSKEESKLEDEQKGTEGVKTTEIVPYTIGTPELSFQGIS